MTWARAAAGAAALVLLAGCAVDEAADVRSYRDVLDAGVAGTPEPPAPGKPLDLATAMRLANARDERLAIEGEAYVRSLLARERAATAFLPRVDLSPAYFLRDSTSGGGTRNGFDLPVDASIDVAPVADAASLVRTASSARQRRALLLALQDSVLLDVGRTLFEVERAERRAAVLRASLDVQGVRVDDSKARLKEGLARSLDVALSESRAADARVRLLDAETAARTGRTLLSFLVGYDVANVPLDDRLAVPAAAAPLDELLRVAAASRPEIVAARHDHDAAVAGAREAVGAWWPSISADLSVFLSRDSEPTDLDWTSFLEVHVPLFTAGRVAIDVRDALSRVRAARHAVSENVRGVRRDVETARERFEAEGRRIEALRVQADAARRSLEQAEALWQTGLATNLERLVAQDELLSTELALTSAELDRRVRHLELLRTTGALHGVAGLVRPEPYDERGDRAEAR